jgi:hypothetical protein
MRLAPTRNYHAVAFSSAGASPPIPGLFFFKKKDTCARATFKSGGRAQKQALPKQTSLFTP